MGLKSTLSCTGRAHRARKRRCRIAASFSHRRSAELLGEPTNTSTTDQEIAAVTSVARAENWTRPHRMMRGKTATMGAKATTPVWWAVSASGIRRTVSRSGATVSRSDEADHARRHTRREERCDRLWPDRHVPRHGTREERAGERPYRRIPFPRRSCGHAEQPPPAEHPMDRPTATRAWNPQVEHDTCPLGDPSECQPFDPVVEREVDAEHIVVRREPAGGSKRTLPARRSRPSSHRTGATTHQTTSVTTTTPSARCSCPYRPCDRTPDALHEWCEPTWGHEQDQCGEEAGALRTTHAMV